MALSDEIGGETTPSTSDAPRNDSLVDSHKTDIQSGPDAIDDSRTVAGGGGFRPEADTSFHLDDGDGHDEATTDDHTPSSSNQEIIRWSDGGDSYTVGNWTTDGKAASDREAETPATPGDQPERTSTGEGHRYYGSIAIGEGARAHGAEEPTKETGNNELGRPDDRPQSQESESHGTISSWVRVQDHVNHLAAHDYKARAMTREDIAMQREVHPVPQSDIKQLLGIAETVTSLGTTDQSSAETGRPGWSTMTLQPARTAHQLGQPLPDKPSQESIKVHTFPQLTWHTPIEHTVNAVTQPGLFGIPRTRLEPEEIAHHDQRRLDTRSRDYETYNYTDPSLLRFMGLAGGESAVRPESGPHQPFNSDAIRYQTRAVIQVTPNDSHRHAGVFYTVFSEPDRSGPTGPDGRTYPPDQLKVVRTDLRVRQDGHYSRHYAPDPDEVRTLTNVLNSAYHLTTGL